MCRVLATRHYSTFFPGLARARARVFFFLHFSILLFGSPRAGRAALFDTGRAPRSSVTQRWASAPLARDHLYVSDRHATWTPGRVRHRGEGADETRRRAAGNTRERRRGQRRTRGMQSTCARATYGGDSAQRMRGLVARRRARPRTPRDAPTRIGPLALPAGRHLCGGTARPNTTCGRPSRIQPNRRRSPPSPLPAPCRV